MKSPPKDSDCAPEKAPLRGVTAKGFVSGSKEKSWKGDCWN
jgi:hypothetical protein